jgi:hypothetical protein
MRPIVGFFIFLTCTLKTLGASALAAPCNPADFLKPEEIEHLTDDYSRIAILESASNISDKNKQATLNNKVYSTYGISNLGI